LPSIKPPTIPKETTTARSENGKEQNEPITNLLQLGKSLNFFDKVANNTPGIMNTKKRSIIAPSPKKSAPVIIQNIDDSEKTVITEALMPDIKLKSKWKAILYVASRKYITKLYIINTGDSAGSSVCATKNRTNEIIKIQNSTIERTGADSNVLLPVMILA